MNEVYAFSTLGRHAHIVHYYSSWVEDDRVYIQSEYCNGGSLTSLVAECRADGRKHLTETELKQLMVHIAAGLKFIHSHALVHLDIKPDNILIQRVGPSAGAGAVSVYDGSMDEGLGEESIDELDHVVYKIGDLGQVTSVTCRSVDEGDCRYLPCELLADQFDDLPKADVFSLALTILEAGSGANLPPNGPLWHEYRRAGIPDLPYVSAEFNALLKSMAAFDVKLRPSSACVMRHAALTPFTHKSSTQLRRELCDERVKNEMLTHELDETRRAFLELQRQMMSTCPPVPGARSQRFVGRSCGRSRSLIAF